MPTSPSAGSSGPATQRSTRAPAEGARDDDPGYDAAPADRGRAPQERSPRAPAEGAADPERGARRSDVAGSGNSLGDGRTAGGAANAHKRDQLKGGGS